MKVFAVLGIGQIGEDRRGEARIVELEQAIVPVAFDYFDQFAPISAPPSKTLWMGALSPDLVGL